MENTGTASKSWQMWARQYGLVAAVYLLATMFTQAHLMLETVAYAEDIAASRFEILGQLPWLSFGWLVSKALMPLTHWIVGPSDRVNVVWTLMLLNWLAGLLSVFLLHGLVRRVCPRSWVVNLVTITFIFSHGFLNLTQTGNPFVPGLSMMLLAFFILVRDGEQLTPRLRSAVFAGLALAGSVSLWAPYLWAVPAALASPLFLYGATRNRIRWVSQTAAVSAFITIMVFGIATAALGVHTIAGLKVLIVESSQQGIVNAGLPRMAIGFARSFVNLGNDGVLFKRYLVGDPFNPVSFGDLFMASLWKLGLFYLALASILITLSRTPRGKRIFGIWLVNAIPVLSFAALWQSGVMERYLTLYPSLFLALACALGNSGARAWFKTIALAFVAVVIVSNISAMARPVVARQQNMAMARINDLIPLLKPHSLVATVIQLDTVWVFTWNFPFHPLNREEKLATYCLVEPGSDLVTKWREEFAARALAVWKEGGDLWVTQRVLSPRPRPEWNWAEGGDRRISWMDLNQFFSHLDLGQRVGGDDGFAQLLASRKNEEALLILVRARQ